MRLTEYLETHKPGTLRDPYIIAEAGVNHEGSMDLAKRLIDEAKEGGAVAAETTVNTFNRFKKLFSGSKRTKKQKT